MLLSIAPAGCGYVDVPTIVVVATRPDPRVTQVEIASLRPTGLVFNPYTNTDNEFSLNIQRATRVSTKNATRLVDILGNFIMMMFKVSYRHRIVSCVSVNVVTLITLMY